MKHENKRAKAKPTIAIQNIKITAESLKCARKFKKDTAVPIARAFEVLTAFWYDKH